MKITRDHISNFRFRITLMLLSVLKIIFLSHCGPVENPFAPPTNTPPPGFITAESLVPEETFSQPSFSANNQLIALGGLGMSASITIDRIYVIDLMTKKPVFVSSESVYEGLSLSPDGSQIAAYQSGPSNDPSPSGYILLLDINTETTSQLTRGNLPTWSSDGSQLAFAHIVSRPGPNGELPIQIKTLDLSTGDETIKFDSVTTHGFIADIKWSPDRTMLAFIMGKARPAYIGNLYVLDLESESVQQLTNNQSILSLNFSPDSSKILYLADTTPTDFGGLRLFVTDLDGNCNQLPDSLLIDGTQKITLSPDGEWIAFDTMYEGVQIAKTATALGSDFWNTNNSCQ